MVFFHLKTRREFLSGFIKGGFAFLAFVFGITLVKFLYPSRTKRQKLRFYYILNEEELPRHGVKKINFSYEDGRRTITFRTFLVNTSSEVFAISSVCTHLGCLIDWSRHKSQFLCPCHGGRYDIEGRVISGPPPSPLTRIPLKVENGKVYIGLAVEGGTNGQDI